MYTLKSVLVGATALSAFFVVSSSHAQDNSIAFLNSDPVPPVKSADGMREYNIRGRMMLDYSAGSDDNPDNNFSGTKLRAGWFGIDAKVNNNVSFKFEADLSTDTVVVRDALVRYTDKDWNVTVGNIRVPHTIDFMTPLSQTTLMERSASRFAFGFGRAMGAIFATGSDNWGLTLGLFQGGYKFTAAENEGFIGSVRGSVGGKVGAGKWMLASSARYRNRNDEGALTYKSKAITRQSMTVSSFASQATKDNLYTLESALTQGSLFATAEYYHLNAKDAIDVGTNAKLSGGYAEVGYILTGEERPMNIKSGAWGRPQVASPLGSGGKGLWMVSARYDVLDLNDKTALGGEQTNYIASVTWYMTRFMRAIMEYGHTVVKDRDFLGHKNNADVMGMRFNIDW
ncbi:OprO/OprP family phosphate-selective porin [Pseudemcibacter aquimaris]|uniref:OprO/OprP family phosphate-selective porin n=1 Tax=Pseudemcibacter aquimaris TaxID=2857064 RepID=UPI0020128970|nr:porin [Pseudemcibacter aquimaris]MCC3860179.1 OprO/OprP family phosphate-selective porin [Pseudemcibacter aquimaris]WDU57505.1 OprO/OprP family phosphate-selective porin [Pseudemcibacter aquimaris]